MKKKWLPMDGPTDGQADKPMDTPSYRDAITHLKTMSPGREEQENEEEEEEQEHHITLIHAVPPANVQLWNHGTKRKGKERYVEPNLYKQRRKD